MATFLDLEIDIKNKIFVYKRFPFFIVRMPDLSGNIPSHVFYGSIMSEFLRIARCTLLYSDFLPSAINLFKRMISQGGSQSRILKQITKAMSRHPEPFSKFSKSTQEIAKDIERG